MYAECALLGAGAVIANDALKVEYLKSKHRELTDAEKEQFTRDESRRFVHFTSRSSAEKIMQSGFLIPTSGVLNNHFTKSVDGKGKKKDSEMVYMFDSATFSVDDYIRNLPRKQSPFAGCYEYYAISTRPNQYDLNDFRKRAQDGAITYEGRLDIDGTDTRLVKYALTLDEQGEYTFTEMGMDEEYLPSEELLAKLEKDRTSAVGFIAKGYASEIRTAKSSLKRFKLEAPEYKEQLRKRKEFIKANKQFIKEEKDKSYIYEQDGRTIVVKNIEYEEVGGKKLQKIAIMEREDRANKKAKDGMTFCYMDEADISLMEPEVAAKYFFNNHDRAKEAESKTPAYIGLPLQNLETGEVVNEYDEHFDKDFRAYMERRSKTKDRLDKKEAELKEKKSLKHKIKAFFSKIFPSKKETTPLLAESPEDVERERLASMGYSSIEAMNNDDKEAKLYKTLTEGTYPPEEVSSYDLAQEDQTTLTKSTRRVEDR